MCYLEFNDIIDFIVNFDVDVIIIEMSCLNMELFDVFVDFKYFNEIGLGVYDIYLFWVLVVEEMVNFMGKVEVVILL